MGGYYGDAFAEVIANELTPVIYDPSHVEAIAREATFAGVGSVSVHLKIDTGMSRLGVRWDSLDPIFECLARNPQVRLDGMMTHFANADTVGLEATQYQCDLFEQAIARAHAYGFTPTTRHAANSAALMRYDRAHYDLVRPGIAIFGVNPIAGLTDDLRPVMRVRSEVIALREIPEGQAAGYNSTWTAARPSRLATIPIGYADGLPRALANRGRVLIRGKSAPIVGAVSMDLITVDVTEIDGISIKDEVCVLGAQQGPLGVDCISAEEIANASSLITWEVLTGISRRVPRFYREP